MAYEPMGFDPGAESDDRWYMRMDYAWHNENARRYVCGEEFIDWNDWLKEQEEMESEDA